MNDRLAAYFKATLDRYENGLINADETLVLLQVAIAEDNEREN
jgi:hypothetical protein